MTASTNTHHMSRATLTLLKQYFYYNYTREMRL
jgi:hypothetical protein